MADTPFAPSVLRLDSALPTKELKKIRDNFSGAVFDRTHLWLGGDEGTSIDRLTRTDDGAFDRHTRFDLAPVLQLPGGAEEIDIEGMDVDGGYLWLIGSHSLKRKKAETDKPAAENIKRLAAVSADGNRYTLARVPIDSSGAPVKKEDLQRLRLSGPEVPSCKNSQGRSRARSPGRCVGRVSQLAHRNGIRTPVAASESRGFWQQLLTLDADRGRHLGWKTRR